MKKPKQMRLTNMPEDVRKILLQEQAALKLKCNCQKSLETTIYALIRQAKGFAVIEEETPQEA